MNLEPLRGLAAGKSITSAIVDLLLMAQPLTAKQIYYQLKKRQSRTATYQAVHKQLKTLLEEGILKKEDLEYQVNPRWLEEIELLTRDMRKRIQSRERVVKEFERKERRFNGQGCGIKVISFDLGGALFDNHYDELLWRTEIPRQYAQRYKISHEEAFERVTAEYRRLWGKIEGWRDPVFWLKHFDIECTLHELTKDIQQHIKPYHDVLPLIRKLSKRYHLVITTHAQRNIIEQKLDRAGIRHHFLKVYSMGQDFSKMTKDAEIYKEICADLGVEPDEVVHIGNKHDLDYLVPTEIGMRAFLIDRVGDRKDVFVIRDLYELEEKLLEAENQ